MISLKKKLFGSLLAAVITLAGMAPSGMAAELADYTAFPPFLPEIVPPNILFLLDYSKSMVRPAYGDCNEKFGDCRTTFFQPGDDFDPTSPYDGYFDPRSRYDCSDGGTCVKSATGAFNGNWLNWLTMTQFDVLKKVVVGGDIDPAPEQGSPTKIRSLLSSGPAFYQIVDEEKCLNGSGDPFAPRCSDKDSLGERLVQEIPYDWIETPTDATVYLENTNQTGGVWYADLPFDFSFFGQTFAAGSKVGININGWLAFNASITSKPTNEALPTSTLYDYAVAPHWVNLEAVNKSGQAESSIKSFTVGEVGERIFVVTFTDMIDEVNDGGKADGMTFQVLFFEKGSQVVFQYKEVKESKDFGRGSKATIGVQGSVAASEYKQYAHLGNPDFSGTLSKPLHNEMALLMTPGAVAYKVTPAGGTQGITLFQPHDVFAETDNDYNVHIDLNTVSKVEVEGEMVCPTGSYLNKDRDTCYDHPTTGLLQDLRDGELAGQLGFRLSIMQLNPSQSTKFNTQTKNATGGGVPDGGVVVKHFNEKDSTGWPSLMSDTRSQKPTSDAPLAEALYDAIGYFKEDTALRFDNGDWTHHDTTSTCGTTGVNYDPYCDQDAAQRVPCAKSYVLLLSSGNYSHDNTTNIYGDAANSETWSNDWSLGYRSTDDSGAEGTKENGGWLDNVAYKAHTTDWRTDLGGKQNLNLYVVNTFGVGSGDGTEVLKKAARYGGFIDLDNDNAYDDNESNSSPDEADTDGDGVPDTYFQASAARGHLKNKIVSAILDILKNSASGTSVSVLSTSSGGEGGLYQAYFYPSRVEGEGEKRRWPGFMRAFFIDRYQNLRDDNSAETGNGTPDARLVLTEDRVAQMYLNLATNEVMADLIHDDDGVLDGSETVDETVNMDDLPSIWEAGEKLARRSKGTRNIYLWLDTDHDGIVDDGDFSSTGGEALSFDTSLASTLKPYLRAKDTYDLNGSLVKSAQTEAEDVISFVRGNDVTGFRNRCITVSGATQETGCSDSNQRVWPLGDIVYSTPSLVGAPGEKYDLIYGDVSYRLFTTTYQNRRQVVYAGANDGMLHAFNAGVYNVGDDTSTSDQIELGYFEANPSSGNGWSTLNPDLGDELWAFIPQDNLPHLPWLACSGTETDPAVCNDAEYTHVYYADHRPKVTDVRIFNDTATGVSGLVDGQSGAEHPNGWGTILILPLRLGGGAINVDLNGDGDVLDAGETGFRSGYYCFDITDPEKRPKLLWRFANPNLGFTTSYPAIVRIEDGGKGKWFMAVGSGPQNSTTTRDYGMTATTQNGRMFVVDLELAVTDPANAVTTLDTGIAGAVMGDPTAVDANLDYGTDVIYVGSAIANTAGRVFRVNTFNDTDPANWQGTVLFDTDTTKSSADPDTGDDMGPLLTPPGVSKDIMGNLWVFFGSGRLFNQEDLNNSDQQRFYGIKDRCWKGLTSSDGCDRSSTTNYAYELADLVNTSAIKVTTTKNGAQQVQDPDSSVCGDGVTECSYTTLLEKSRATHGWYVDLDNPSDEDPSERVLSRPSVLGGLVMFTSYSPAGDMCSILGESYLYALYYETGTAYIESVIGSYTETTDGLGETSTTDYDDNSGDIVKKRTGLGLGMPTSVGVAIGETVSGFVQKSTGEIMRIEAKPGLGVRSGFDTWRESLDGGAVEIETIYKHIVK